MKALTWIWQHLDGIKTILGGILHAVWFLYYITFDKEVSFEHQLTGHGIIGILTGVGLGHKGVKWYQKYKLSEDGKGNI